MAVHLRIHPERNAQYVCYGYGRRRGLAFNSAGDLFEADRLNGTIYELTPNGSRTVFVSGLDSPYALAFQGAALPVPEPGMLALFGAGAIVLAFRRSKEKRA